MENKFLAPRSRFKVDLDKGVSTIQTIVAAQFCLSLDEMASRSRPLRVAWPRQVAMYLCTELLFTSTVQIGRRFMRGHATVLHSRQVVLDICQVYADVRSELSDLRNLCIAALKEL